MITPVQIDAVAKLIPGKEHVVILTHLSPDGDAMGSALGLKLWLRDCGCADVQVIVPNLYPDFLAWLPTAGEIIIYGTHKDAAEQAVHNADLLFCVDFNEPKRIGDAAELTITSTLITRWWISSSPTPKPPPPATSFSSSSMELMRSKVHAKRSYPLRVKKGQRSTVHAKRSYELQRVKNCQQLYCGLMTDTGNFAFNSNNPVLYEMIAELLRAGINKDRIFDNVFNQYTSNRMELMGYCLFRKMKIYKKYHTALITLSSSELRRFGYQKGDTEGFVNLPLQISDVYYSVFMREDSDRIKLSFRSQGDRPVNILAHDIFNGGGHMNAAGGESFGTLDNTVKTFEDHFRDYFNK